MYKMCAYTKPPALIEQQTAENSQANNQTHTHTHMPKTYASAVGRQAGSTEHQTGIRFIIYIYDGFIPYGFVTKPFTFRLYNVISFLRMKNSLTYWPNDLVKARVKSAPSPGTAAVVVVIAHTHARYVRSSHRAQQ